ncbi:uncharacterized protein A1O9_10407 [Exophiala aquamarina CBS 119918]|uniref:FAD-binding domain-containing protein n=1 Tax=Exophiala aquamarina CBS 119918 TaxID=1182545 RepID=A0A072P182_9EURO|nr:uncharacterized protein A1O9_10407 [Exophiala aquamarina CBS 119918]KEF53432.1 hypothetical protein A1O9_10407 [Exophiala aquamarina CBS 119918]
MIDIPVVIVGGGGCGLSLSCFLSNYGIEHVLLEKHHDTSVLPKAHYLNQRSMEIFRLHNLEDELRNKSCPARYMSQIAWMSTLGGKEFDANFPCRNDAPVRSVNLPLCRMEPILRRLATEKTIARVLFDHIVTDIRDDGDYVYVGGKDTDGVEFRYRAKYLVGADGGRTVGPKIGVEMEGEKGLTDMISVHFLADLSQYWDERFFACHMINGNCGTVFESGAIVPMGPNWGKHSKEWIFHFGFDLDDEARFEEEKLIPRIREILNIPNLDIKPIKTSHWIIEAVLANKYRQGRVFIAGDAAHKRPPTTGLGLNTAIEDSYNLAWKLSLVLKEKADARILDTYESERRAIGRRNVDWGLFTFQNSAVINAVIGLVPGQTASNRARFAKMFEDSEIAAALRAQTAKIIDSQRIEFSAHNIELGFKYGTGGFVVDDGTEPDESDPLGQNYVPSTRPGSRLPHAWIELLDKKMSTHDVAGSDGGFALFTDDVGEAWISVAHRFANFMGIKISIAQFGPLLHHVKDCDDVWAKVKGIKRGGALFVRPDNIVAWRSLHKSRSEGGELMQALELLFGRGIATMNGVNGTK